MSKFIVFCADGTWNAPDQDDNDDGVWDPTNVFKLFGNLQGVHDPMSTGLAKEQESSYHDSNGKLLQVAKYIHGVGDSRNKIRQVIGGAFGTGVISRIVRGYTFISRNYEKGDQIVIAGFSRGAYTARALAGLIADQGVLNKEHTTDKEQAYRKGAQAWFRYRSKVVPTSTHGLLASFTEVISDLPAYISKNHLADSDFTNVPSIAAVAVWDTVGAMGVPSFRGPKSDAFKFVSNELSGKVLHGLHAIAVDEQRDAFIPSLWAHTPNVTQMLFPGAHSDVGGGYAECGLADGALNWTMRELEQRIGLFFLDNPAFKLTPDFRAASHEPWRERPWKLGRGNSTLRNFAETPGLMIHDSVHQRMTLDSVNRNPGPKAGKYVPANLSGLLK